MIKNAFIKYITGIGFRNSGYYCGREIYAIDDWSLSISPDDRSIAFRLYRNDVHQDSFMVHSMEDLDSIFKPVARDIRLKEVLEKNN